MNITRNKLYWIILTACTAGYIWLYCVMTSNRAENKSLEVCWIKCTTNIPCPSCGTTRSVISITDGNFRKAFEYNPIGFIISLIMIISPTWIISDVIFKNNSFYKCYVFFEFQLKKPKYATPLILLVIVIWVWNITKGL